MTVERAPASRAMFGLGCQARRETLVPIGTMFFSPQELNSSKWHGNNNKASPRSNLENLKPVEAVSLAKGGAYVQTGKHGAVMYSRHPISHPALFRAHFSGKNHNFAKKVCKVM